MVHGGTGHFRPEGSARVSRTSGVSGWKGARPRSAADAAGHCRRCDQIIEVVLLQCRSSAPGTLLPNARTLLHPQLAIGDRGNLGRPWGYDRIRDFQRTVRPDPLPRAPASATLVEGATAAPAWSSPRASVSRRNRPRVPCGRPAKTRPTRPYSNARIRSGLPRRSRCPRA
jgi:hypothetical protein